MTYVSTAERVGIRKGEELGLRKGLEEGKVIGEGEILVFQLTVKFQTVLQKLKMFLKRKIG